MLSRVYSCAVVGLEGVIVEVDTTHGLLVGTDIVGLPKQAGKRIWERKHFFIYATNKFVKKLLV